MLKISGISAIVLLFYITPQTTLVSCTKTNTVVKTVVDTVTVIQKDTITIKDTTLTTPILTANSWKIQEIRGILGTTAVYYLRGGSGNTMNLDNEFITFSSNNTGVYTDNFGTPTTFTWNFTDATNTKLIWNWNWNSTTLIPVTWEHIYYKDGAIHYTENYILSGQNEVGAGIRIPK
jgi:hypothetical protein